jgi:hypothetical protein
MDAFAPTYRRGTPYPFGDEVEVSGSLMLADADFIREGGLTGGRGVDEPGVHRPLWRVKTLD